MSAPSSINSPSARTKSRENEGGRVEPVQTPESLDVEAASLGVKRQMTETFLVGGFRYSRLADAIAETRRMAKLESELL